MKRAHKIDGNQNRIVKELRDIPGISVRITSMVGSGFADLVVGFRKQNYLFELKDSSLPPSRRQLTEDEKKFRDTWHGHYSVCETLEEILQILKLR
jgi:hypothetical protein